MFSMRNIARFASLNAMSLMISSSAFAQNYAPQPSGIPNVDNIMAQEESSMAQENELFAQDMRAVLNREERLLHNATMAHAIATDPAHTSKEAPRLQQVGYFQSVEIRMDGNKEQKCIRQANLRGNGEQFSITSAQATGNEAGCMSPHALGRHMSSIFPERDNQDFAKVTPVIDVTPASKSYQSKEKHL